MVGALVAAPIVAHAATQTAGSTTEWGFSAKAAASTAGDSYQIASSYTAPSAAGSATAYVFDTEIFTADYRTKVAQFHTTKTVKAGETAVTTSTWKTSTVSPGKYRVALGVFTNNWSQGLQWQFVREFTVEPASVVKPNPFSTYGMYGTNPGALQQAKAWQSSRPADAALMQRMGQMPTAIWIGDWIGDIQTTVSQHVMQANRTGTIPVFVAYNILARDCNDSSVGVKNEQAYKAWIDKFAAGIGNYPAAVIVEPDALPLLCGDVESRYRMMNYAVDTFAKHPKVSTYLDAGHANWLSPQVALERLRKAGADRARGFSLNVSNFESDAKSVAYGEKIAQLSGGKYRYVIDSSRSGNGSNGQWCNPLGHAVGHSPAAGTQGALDAYLWIKVPGESDGTCNGGPAAGGWWADYALGLARLAWGA